MFGKVTKVGVAAIFGIQTFLGPVAFAQTATGSQNCTCSSSVQGAGAITSVKGNVLVTQVDGMRPAVAGSVLTSQSRIIVGSAGVATIGLGGCKLSITENSQAIVSRIGDQLCVKVESLVISPVAADGAANGLLPLLAGAALLGGGVGLAIALSDNNNPPVSP